MTLVWLVAVRRKTARNLGENRKKEGRGHRFRETPWRTGLKSEQTLIKTGKVKGSSNSERKTQLSVLTPRERAVLPTGQVRVNTKDLQTDLETDLRGTTVELKACISTEHDSLEDNAIKKIDSRRYTLGTIRQSEKEETLVKKWSRSTQNKVRGKCYNSNWAGKG